MRIPYQQLERRPDTIDLSDITASRCTGPAFPTVGAEWIDIPFDVEPTAEEQRLILLRLQTADNIEEDRSRRVRAALVELKKLRDGTSTLSAENRWRLVGRVLVLLVLRVWRLDDPE